MNCTSSNISPSYCHSKSTKPHLFTLKTKVNGHEIKILVDGGSDYILISNSLIDKIKTQYHGSVILDIEAVAGCSTTAQGNLHSLAIHTKEGRIHIPGYNLAEFSANVKENKLNDIYKAWPNLNHTLRKQVIENRFLGPTCILIRQDNY